MSFADIKHQNHAVRSVQRAIGRDRVPHAYLFHGPDGVGKERLAVALAELLLCGEPREAVPGDGGEPIRSGCGRCEDCRSVIAGSHPDLHLIYRQLNREHPDPEVRKRKGLEIGVDVLRHFVIEKVGRTPARGRAKVFIIREADRITTQAQNALLKTLEEPPGATVLVLLVTSLDRLLATTLSRCQVVRFDALPTAFVRERLASLRPDLSADKLGWYARFSDGSIGRAVECVDDGHFEVSAKLATGFSRLAGGEADPAGETAAWTEASKSLGEHYGKRDPDITDTEATRRGLKAVFKLAATWYADALRCQTGGTNGVVNAQDRTQLDAAAAKMDRRDLIAAIGRLTQAERHLDLNANTQLVVETLINDLARLGRGMAVAAS